MAAPKPQLTEFRIYFRVDSFVTSFKLRKLDKVRIPFKSRKKSQHESSFQPEVVRLRFYFLLPGVYSHLLQFLPPKAHHQVYCYFVLCCLSGRRCCYVPPVTSTTALPTPDCFCCCFLLNYFAAKDNIVFMTHQTAFTTSLSGLFGSLAHCLITI